MPPDPGTTADATRSPAGSGGGPVVLFFVDGLGWGSPDDPANPTQTYGGDLLRLPAPPVDNAPVPVAGGGWGRPLDARLGVEGLPQSATGQTTLLTGVNAAAALGRHKEGFPGPRLRAILLEHSLLRRLAEAGRRTAFFNAFRDPFFAWPRERQLRTSATTVANLAAGNRFFTLADAGAGRALYHDITGRELRDHGAVAPPRTPAEAGAILAAEAGRYDFLLYEYFLTDRDGHAGRRADAEARLRQLDDFLAAALAGLARRNAAQPGALLLLTSDHGNVEDLSTRAHTLAPVPLLAWGHDACAFVAGPRTLADVAPAILRRFDAQGRKPSR